MVPQMEKSKRIIFRTIQLENSLKSISPKDFDITVRYAAPTIQMCYNDKPDYNMEKIYDYRFLIHCSDLLNKPEEVV